MVRSKKTRETMLTSILDFIPACVLWLDRVKGNGQPFGGIQLVLCGDFFQLPPVGIGRGSTRFCFEAKTWDTSIDQSIVLKQVGLTVNAYLVLAACYSWCRCWLWYVEGWFMAAASELMNTGYAVLDCCGGLF